MNKLLGRLTRLRHECSRMTDTNETIEFEVYKFKIPISPTKSQNRK